jgi:glycosyltransferase involved in cell wall biosynthesis
MGRWQRQHLLAADRIVAISRDIREQLLFCGVQESRIRLIPNGVDVPKEKWDANDPHRYGAVCIANLSQQPLKGLDVLIEAWAIVRKAQGPVQLVVCGRGNATSLIELAHRYGVGELIEFKGSVENVTSILVQADLFVLPSRVEGMSNVLLEAMAVGMPCVATSVSGSVDLIDHGRNGMLVPVEDPMALAKAISAVLSSQATRANLGREARRCIEKSYTTEHMISRYRDVLGELDPSLSRLRAQVG